MPEPGVPGISRTALVVNAYCAFAARHPELKRAFFDPMAEIVFARAGQDGAAILDRLRNWADVVKFIAAQPGGDIDIVARVVWRKMWIERQMRAALDLGARQAVILGGGFDTIGLRLANAYPRIPIFEIDQPNTQSVKRPIVESAFGMPGNFMFVPVDFAREQLPERLLATSYDPAARGVFLAEVVLEYVPPADVDRIFAFIRARSDPKTRLIFTFLPPEALKAGMGAAINASVRQADEPFRFTLEPAQLDKFLGARGFRKLAVTTLPAIRDTYRIEHSLPQDTLPAIGPSLFRYVVAETL
ncbi:MAG: class I SAM-dependent methyltransferase [Alphaproteobacteria bacterium]